MIVISRPLPGGYSVLEEGKETTNLSFFQAIEAICIHFGETVIKGDTSSPENLTKLENFDQLRETLRSILELD